MKLFEGRMNRRDYFFKIAFGFFSVAAFWIALITIGESLDIERTSLPSPLIRGLFVLLWTLPFLAFLASLLIFTIKRFRDFGQSGWFTLLLALPAVNVLTVLALFFIPGDEADNIYGPTKIN